MSFSRYFDLFVPVVASGTQAAGAQPKLLASEANNSPANAIAWVGKDNFTLRLHLDIPSDGSLSTQQYIGAQIAAGDVIVFSGRPSNNLFQASLLFSCTGFAEHSVAVGGQTSYWYEAALNLNTTNLVNTIGAAPLTTTCTLQVQDAANTARLSFQFAVQILPPGFLGTEGVPVDGDPPYPVATAIALRVPAESNYQIGGPDGVTDVLFRLWNPTQGKYQTISLTGAAGAEQLVISAS